MPISDGEHEEAAAGEPKVQGNKRLDEGVPLA